MRLTPELEPGTPGESYYRVGGNMNAPLVKRQALTVGILHTLIDEDTGRETRSLLIPRISVQIEGAIDTSTVSINDFEK